MLSVGFKPAIPANDQPKTVALDFSVTEIDNKKLGWRDVDSGERTVPVSL
jgi:hypothetical protein